MIRIGKARFIYSRNNARRLIVTINLIVLLYRVEPVEGRF